MASSKLTIKVEIFRGQRRDTFLTAVWSDTTVRQAVETCCHKYSIVEDWNYGFFNEENKKWLIDWSMLNAYSSDILNALMLRIKSPEYHDQEAQSISNQTLMYTTGRPPIITVHQLPMINEHSSHHTNHRFLSSISGLFVKNEKRTLDSKIRDHRLYLSVLLFAGDGRVLITREGLLPTICVNQSNEALCRDLESNSEEFRWILRDALDWERGIDKHQGISPVPMHSRRKHQHRPARSVRMIGRRRKSQAHINNAIYGSSEMVIYGRSNSANDTNAASNDEELRWRDAERAVREDFAIAAAELRRLLRLPTLGVMHERPISINSGEARLLLMVQHIPTERLGFVAPDAVRTGLLKWRERDHMDKTIYEWQEDLWWRYQCAYNGRLSRLAGGLYVAVFYAENTLRGLNLLVPRRRRSFLPVCKIRNNTALTEGEFEWLDNLSDELDIMPTATHNNDGNDGNNNNNNSTAKQSNTTEQPSKLSEEDVDNVEFSTAFTRAYHGLQGAVQMGWRTKDIYLKRCMTLDNEGNLQFEEDFHSSTAARILLIVKPMRPAQTQSGPSHESGEFEMFPLTLFEMLHQQNYNPIESSQIRVKTQTIAGQLLEHKEKLRKLLNISNSVASHPCAVPIHRRRATLPTGNTSESITDDDDDDDDDDEPPIKKGNNTKITKKETVSTDSINSTVSNSTMVQIANTELAITRLEEELALIRRQTSDSLWTRRIITWDRDRVFRRTMMLASPSMSYSGHSGNSVSNDGNDDDNQSNSPTSDISYIAPPPSLSKIPIRNSVNASMPPMSVPVHTSK